MRHLPLPLVTAFGVASLLFTVRVAAQGPAQGSPAAAQVEALYNDAAAEMDAKNYKAACPLLVKAVDLAPDTAIGARLKLAECYEKWGKLASAWRQYVQAAGAAQRAGQEERRQRAEARSAELRASVAVLKIVVPVDQRRLSGLTLSVDGKDVPVGATEVPVDRGAHAIMVSATGYVSRTFQVKAERDGVQVSVTIPPLEPVDVASDKVSSKAPVPPAILDGQTASAGTAAGQRSKLPGFILGGAGVAAAIAGGALIAVAESTRSDISNNVPRLPNGDPACGRDAVPGENPQCTDFRSKASSGSAMGNAGVGLLVGGGVLVAGAVVYLLLPAKKAIAGNSRVIPVVGQTGGGLVLTGSF